MHMPLQARHARSAKSRHKRAVERSGAKAAAPHKRDTGGDDGQSDHEAHRTNEMRVEPMGP